MMGWEEESMTGKRLRVSNPIKISLIVVCISLIVVCLLPLLIFINRWHTQIDDNCMLFDAVVRRDTSAMRQALKAGANINAECSNGNIFWGIEGTPLLEASSETLPILLEWGANVNQRVDKDGDTVLHRTDDPKMVRLLLQNHANPNLRNKYGYTPLDVALRSGSRASELLRQAGAKTGKELDAEAKH